MEKFVLFVLAIFLMGVVSATCSSGQIDINTATISQLDNLYGIGPSKAQSIINARPYNSVDNLTKAVGIGPVTLQKIKEQNLACVNDSKNKSKENNSKSDSKKENSNENNSNIFPLKNETINLNQKTNSKKDNLNLSSPIDITPKDIKSSKTLSSQGKSFDSKYLFLIFCIFLLGLYVIKSKKEKRKKKNEWR